LLLEQKINKKNMLNKKDSTRKAIGVCIGASTISMVKIHQTRESKQIKKVVVQDHKGAPKKTFSNILKKINSKGHTIAVTGRKFRNIVTLPQITEPESVEYSLKYLYTREEYPTAVVSAGNESFLVYTIDKYGKVVSISSGNKCASGTGEFFLQQIRRMNLEPQDAVKEAQRGVPYNVSGRCSVFCKSDCTHALNKGVPITDVTAGLCKMIANKIIELLVKVPAGKVMIVGGMTKNPTVIEYIEKELSNIHVPKESFYFEALGAALWSLENGDKLFEIYTNYFLNKHSSFTYLKPLSYYDNLVDFKKLIRGHPKKKDRCIIGLDVGSTTTKAVIIRTENSAILASEYIRTNGEPIEASRTCYKSLYKQVPHNLNIVGLGVTGSGRQIAGLYSLTQGVINEIIAHAAAAAYFDPEVDTIFEIGGQDAKYTCLVNHVPCDYAMNEACSAGTGSFLEESAYESIGIKMKDIADISLKATKPLNFSDQCAAFISSDIKTALQEGATREDIVAGLVYSICINYTNRVKGNRAIGKKIFFQGGVCYNRAIPLAMAGIIRRKIIVPPEPGLMGAFGVALEVKNRIDLKILPKQSYSLKTLTDRKIEKGNSFTCKGGKEQCDRACPINVYKIEGKTYPFGGACNKYYNLRYHLKYNVEKLDYIKKRQQLVYKTFTTATNPTQNNKPVQKPLIIGMNKSFKNHNLYPLFYNFFTQLGCHVVLSDTVYESGIEKATTTFCYPAQIAHGLFEDLLKKEPDYIFLPHITELFVAKEKKYRQEFQTTCMMTQGEPFYLLAAFKDRKVKGKLLRDIFLTPTLNMASGYGADQKKFLDVAVKLGFGKSVAKKAHTFAVAKQMEFFRENKKLGKQLLEELKNNPNQIAIVLFGRAYNAFSLDANKGIPYKFASRGILIIPYDCLPYEEIPNWKNQYWEIGQRILRAAQIVRDHPQLFGTYMTNFLCAPDSLLIQHFRDVMGKKPSLTLEVDEHTADAGINTRIDAVLDVIKNYLEIQKNAISIPRKESEPFRPAQVVIEDMNTYYIDSDGNKLKLTDPQIKLILPSMSTFAAEGSASAFKAFGINTEPLPEFTTDAFRLAMTYHSGKECLPMIIMSGSLMKYMRDRKNNGEKLVYFTVGSGGNCRVGQYNTFLKRLIEQKQWKNVATMALNNEDSYAGMGFKFRKLLWTILLISDIMRDIHWVIQSSAKDKKMAIEVYNEEWETIRSTMEIRKSGNILKQLKRSMRAFRKKIQLERPLNQLKYVGVLGEIFTRLDHFSLQNIPTRLAERGLTAKVAPIHEWILYMDYCIKHGYQDPEYNLKGRIEAFIARFWQQKQERTIKKICSFSGLYDEGSLNIDHYIRHSAHLVPPHLKGEPGLSSGNALSHMIDKYCGVINIGPFGCMNSRLLESVLIKEMTVEGKKRSLNQAGKKYKWDGQFNDVVNLPFFSVETDGNPFPQIVEAQFENFCIQADRLHDKMISAFKK
jgi:predicted CoA-substrate-specific enzyme activase